MESLYLHSYGVAGSGDWKKRACGEKIELAEGLGSRVPFEELK